MNRSAVSTLPVLLFVAVFIPLTASRASASGILIDAFTTPQTLTAPGCQFIGGFCIDPAQTTFSSVVTGTDILGGTREMTVSNTTTGSPESITGSVANSRARLEGITMGSMLLEWDANGAGLDLDLSDMLGLTIGRGTSDGGFDMTIRLLSINGSMLLFSADLGDWSALGDPDRSLFSATSYHVGTYTFDRFQEIGNPNLHHIDAVQIEITRHGGVAGGIGDLSFAPQAVPDDTTTRTLLLLGVLSIVIFQHRRVIGSVLTRN